MREINHSANALELEHVSFSYSENAVLSDITLTVPKGDYLGIIGPNGAGKTTLLKLALGLLVPKKGSVRLFGKDIAQFTRWAKIGYVPQSVTHFDAMFPATANEVALMGRYAARGLFHAITKTDRRRAHFALEQVGMEAYRNRLIGELSGGQQQRVFIARALAADPDIIFLDEPTIGVDQNARADFYVLLKRLNKELGMTLVLVSHDVETVAHEAKHLACVDHSIVYDGTPEGFFSHGRAKDFLRITEEVRTH